VAFVQHAKEAVSRSNGLLPMPKLQAFVFLFVLGSVGCKNVQPRDIAGTWVINDAARKFLPTELQNASAQIVLGTNGRFVASDMPGLFYSPARFAARLESGTGSWKLVPGEGKQQVQLDFQTIKNWKDNLPYGTQLDVADKSLVYFLGDADEGRRITLVKK
jgi:hypothetical protein